MVSKSRVVIRIFLVLALLSVALPAVWADDPAPWCAYMGASRTDVVLPEGSPKTLTPTQARYEVDLLGNLANGSLVLEFANPGESDLYMKFFARKTPALQLTDLVVGEDLEVEARPLRHQAAKTEQRSQPRGKKAAASGADQGGLGSDEVIVPAEESLWIRASFTQTLRFRDGHYRLLLPALGGSCSSGQPDAATPLTVTLRVHHEEELELAESPSHAVLVEFEGDQTVVETVAPDALGRKAFAFDFALGLSNEPALSSYVTPPTRDGERDVLMVFAPSIAPADETIRLKEVLFVIDTSGSMAGPKLDAARGALLVCLEQLNAEDRFNLVEFDGSFTALFEDPEEASTTALSQSVGWLQAQQAGGSTTLLPALDATLKQARSSEHHRLVVVLTDGAIGDEGKVSQFLQEHLEEARLFFVGVGAEPNRDKVRRLAESARGSAVFADDPQGFAVAVQELFAGISAPLAWDLKLDWGDAEVLAIDPPRMPDLYSGRPVTVKARVKGELPPTLVLEAATTGGVRTFEALLPAGGAREYPQVPGLKTKDASGSKRKGAR